MEFSILKKNEFLAICYLLNSAKILFTPNLLFDKEEFSNIVLNILFTRKTKKDLIKNIPWKKSNIKILKKLSVFTFSELKEIAPNSIISNNSLLTKKKYYG